MKALSVTLGFLLLAVSIMPMTASALEVTSNVYRYRQYELSTGYYEAYEVRPKHSRPFVIEPEMRRGVVTLGEGAAQVRLRTRLADSHMGILFYEGRTCLDCHQEKARTLHVVRNKITCRQCHGGEPIASRKYYYSPLNPIRRHAYVCSKCHEGASTSYASYVIHEPNPALRETAKSFPALFYVFWIMIGIAGGTFVVFLPHTFLWVVRELFQRQKRGDG